jgi:hypothetical protein
VQRASPRQAEGVLDVDSRQPRAGVRKRSERGYSGGCAGELGYLYGRAGREGAEEPHWESIRQRVGSKKGTCQRHAGEQSVNTSTRAIRPSCVPEEWVWLQTGRVEADE